MISKIDRYVDKMPILLKNKGLWNYEDNCILKGLLDLFTVNKTIYYYNCVSEYLNVIVDGNGNIAGYRQEENNLDNICGGRVLISMYEYSYEDKLEKAIRKLAKQVGEHPRAKCGCLCHKSIYRDQIWLDGIYMAQPFRTMYALRMLSDNIENESVSENRSVIAILQDVYKHLEFAREKMYNPDIGLYFHGYDEAHAMFWANSDTGLSHSVWLRSEGWYLMALVDIIKELEEKLDNSFICKMHIYVLKLYIEAVEGIIKYIDETAMLKQVIWPLISIEEGNYYETSGNLMVAYALMRCGEFATVVKDADRYVDIGRKMFRAIVDNKLIEDDDGIRLVDTCHMAGLGPDNRRDRDGSAMYYINEPRRDDDAKGAGVLLMAYAAYEKV